MYESFYGLKEKPFNLTPDPAYLYMSRVHENAHTHLEYALAENKGFVVVTGEIGSGKTTLINYLLQNLGQDMEVGIVNQTNVNPTQFLRMVCTEFGMDVDGMDKAAMIDAFHSFLIQEFSGRKRVVLIIDEAQNLPLETIEEIRMLSNLEAEKHHLIQIVLSGQPDLKPRLLSSKTEQFAQRVTVYCHMGGLKKEEVKAYIHHRLRVAGSDNPGSLFDSTAINAIYENSHGIPRLINVLCDTALVCGFAEEIRVIDAKVIKEAAVTGRLEPSNEDAGAQLDPAEEPHRDTLNQERLVERLHSMEKRIQKMEKAVTDLAPALKAWTMEIGKREGAIHKLLHDIRQDMETWVKRAADRDLQEKKTEKRPARFSILRRKK